ncbi:MAG: hypothetical protein IMHGJWDQ_000873 [Candidatus Fervidibacter sp.]
MTTDPLAVVGLRQEEALARLEAQGKKVRVLQTRPPRPRIRGEPVAWRVITARETEEGIELVVTPEWIDWLPLRASGGLEEGKTDIAESSEARGVD